MPPYNSSLDEDPGNPSAEADLPPIGQGDPKPLRKWVDEGLTYESTIYGNRCSTNRKAELFDQGKQWLQPASSGYDSGGYSQWVSADRDFGNSSAIPMPVFNEMFGARTNESTRLARPDYLPVVKASFSNQDIKIKTQVRNSQRALLHRLKQIKWERTIDIVCLHLPLYGGAWVRSEWLSRWDETILVPLSASQCPQCQGIFAATSPAAAPQERNTPRPALSKLSQPGDPCPVCSGMGQGMSPGMSPGMGQGMGQGMGMDMGGGQMSLPGMTPPAPPLNPYQPSMEEAGNTDRLGNPLGEPQPIGDWDISICSPYDVFPRNMGIDMTPGDDVPDITESRVVSLDYISLRWPDQAPNVKSESPAALALYHPIAGSPHFQSGMMGSTLFRNSTRLKSRHKRPWVEKGSRLPNKGRSVIMAGNEILLDAPFLLDSLNYKGEFVPRVHYEYIPWEYRDGARTLQGMSQSELLFDAQEGANEARSQTMAVRQRMALPYYIVSKSHNLEIQAAKEGVAGSFWMIDPDPTMPNQMPQRFNNETIDAGVSQEREDYLSFISRTSLREVETGAVPPGADAGVTVRLLKEAAGEQREARIKRIKIGCGSIFKHGADLQSHLYIEPRDIAYMDDIGQEAWDVVAGTDLCHNPIVEAEPSQSDEDEQRLLIQSLVTTGVITPGQMDIRTKLKIARLQAGQTQQSMIDDLFEDENKQEKSAKEEFVRFRDQNRIPVVDPSLDNSATHYDQHGRDCLEEYFQNLSDQAGWSQALKILGPQWGQLNMWVTNQGMGQPAQDVLVQVWTSVLMQAGFMPLDQEAFGRVLQFRAHMEAHKIMAEQMMMAAQMQPTLPAPGSPTAPGGTAETPGQEAQPMPGQAAVAQATAQQSLVNQ